MSRPDKCPRCGKSEYRDHERCLLQALIEVEIIADICKQEGQRTLPAKWAGGITRAVDDYRRGLASLGA